MITSRFHKDEAVLQRDTLIRKSRKRRLLFFSLELVVMLVLFFAIPIALKQMQTAPFFMPLFPAILVPLAFGAVFLATGAYFKKRLYAVSDLIEKPAVRASHFRYGMIWTVFFVVVLLIVLIAFPPFGGTNFAESALARDGSTTVGSNTYIRLQFQGADSLATFRSEVTVKSNNNVSLDFYLMYRSDADSFDPSTPPTNSINPPLHATKFAYTAGDLDSRDYTLIISNSNNDSAEIHYTVFDRTSDTLSVLLLVFFIVYAGMAAGWVVHVRSLAKKEALPPATPPMPIQLPAQFPMPGPPQPGTGMPVQGMPAYAPAPSPESGGVPMSITCPRCNTSFEVMRGAGSTKIKCPNCGKEGTLAGLPPGALAAARAQQAAAPAPPQEQPAAAPSGMQYAPQYREPAPAQQQYQPQYQPEYQPQYQPEYQQEPAQGRGMPAAAQPQVTTLLPYEQAPPQLPPRSAYEQLMSMGIGGAEAIPEAPATPVEMPPEAPAPAPPAPAMIAAPPPAHAAPMRTIACPRCKQAFQIDKVEGPQQIRCPHCGKEGIIGARKQAAPAPPGATAPPTGAQPMPAPAPAPVRAAPAAPAQAAPPRPAPGPAARALQTPSPAPRPQAPGPAGPKMIACPQCKKPFAVAETRRPLQVKCPNCGKEGVLRK